MKIKTLVSSSEGIRGCDLGCWVLVMFYFLLGSNWTVDHFILINFLICIYIYFHVFFHKCYYMCVLSLDWLFVTPWTIVHHAPLSMAFSRQEYWSGLPFPSPWNLPHPEIKPESPASPALVGRFFTTAPPGKPESVGRSVVSDSLQPQWQ